MWGGAKGECGADPGRGGAVGRRALLCIGELRGGHVDLLSGLEGGHPQVRAAGAAEGVAQVTLQDRWRDRDRANGQTASRVHSLGFHRQWGPF